MDRRRRYTSKIIWFGFSIVIATMAAFATTGIHYLSDSKKNFTRVVAQHNVQIHVMSEFLRLARERSLTLQHMFMTNDPFDLDDHRMLMSDIAQDYLHLREEVLQTDLDEEESELLTAQHVQTSITGRLQNQIAELLIDGEIEPAKRIFYNEAIPSQEKAMSLMGEFIALQHIHNSMELSKTSREIEFEKKVMAALLAFGLVISFIIASRVVAKINKEIEQRNKVENELEERVERRTQELTYLASHDSLTELPNRTVFNEQLGNSIQQAKRYKKCSALLFLDLDGFKAVNDGYGHAAGDYALREVAGRLRHIIRGSDVLARVGGDEFTIILNDVKEESNATRICEQVIASLNQPIDFSGINLQLGVSIGITFFMNDRRSADELLTEADDAMYIAKDLGKNRMQISKHADRESNVHPFPGERSNA